MGELIEEYERRQFDAFRRSGREDLWQVQARAQAAQDLKGYINNKCEELARG